VRQVLSDTGVAPACLELEFNETDAMLFLADDRSCLNSLSALGVRIAIDDFNVGHAGSLARLQTLPISRLMIDRRFVRDLATSSDARVVSHCFIDIGKTMGLEVIACGVESAEQLAVLEEQGCHLVQGFYTGKPMRADELFALARSAAQDAEGSGLALSAQLRAQL
jgi:EAL domain-containing protein (putative c-di-GMP-specific phosphodiesterase class I)